MQVTALCAAITEPWAQPAAKSVCVALLGVGGLYLGRIGLRAVRDRRFVGRGGRVLSGSDAVACGVFLLAVAILGVALLVFALVVDRTPPSLR